MTPSPVMTAFDRLVQSDRVSAGTRAVLLARAHPDDPAYQPACLNAAQLATLRAMLDRVIPQAASAWIDLAARIDGMLASGEGDGWRHAALPGDAEAYRRGLDTLDAMAQTRHGRSLGQLEGGTQDGLLHSLDEVSTPFAAGALTPEQMRLWSEDVRSDAVRLYVAHPATSARIFYDGFANGGDGPGKSGFVRVGAGEREAWEPAP